MLTLPILVVDDEPQVRLLIRAVLSKRGFRIMEATDGASALSILRDLHGAIALVITDYSMPGFNGDVLAQLVKAQFPIIPVLLVSADENAPGCASGDAFVAKPFPLAKLMEAVRLLLSRQRQCA
jgi:DNA-binding response OmpR family regulator